MISKLVRALCFFAVVAAGCLLLFLSVPFGAILARPLENRFPPPRISKLNPTGIIALGGTFVPNGEKAHQAETLGSGNRLIQAVLLAKRFPKARLVFSGGAASPSGNPHDEAHDYGAVATALGVPPSRISYEFHSHNTYENAIFTRELVRPKPGEQWILVTSALHMPRAVGSFREAQFDVVPDPVDYRTKPSLYKPWRSDDTALKLVNEAVHEWIGLAVYRVMGRTGALFPAPHP